jgi:hypothetical protein
MIESILMLSGFTLLSFLVVYFASKNVSVRRKLHNALSDKLQSEINKNIVAAEYAKAIQEIQNMKLEKSDDFVKFLSDTRETAFVYIEDTQKKIAEFDKLLQEVAEWNRTYGTVAGDVPHAEKIEQISLAFDSIRALLPEKPTPNN